MRHALDELDGPGPALQEPQVTVAGHVDQSLHRPAVPLEVHQNGRRHLVPIERLVGRVLEVALDLPRGHVHGDRRGGVEVVARTLVAHPRSTVARAPIGQVRLGIVVARHPHRAAAGLPLLAAPGPRLAPGLARRRNGVGAPQFLAGVRVVGGDEPADAELTARRADEHFAIGHERREAHVVAAAVVGDGGGPHRASRAGVQSHQHGIAGGQEHLVPKKADAAGRRMPIDDCRPERATIAPQHRARRSLDRNHLAAGRCDEHHTVVHDGRGLVPVDRAGRKRPHRLQPGDVGSRDLREGAIAPPVVRPTVHHPVAVVRIPQPRLGDRRVVAEHGRHGRGPGRRLRRKQRRRGVLGPQHGRSDECECERNGSERP